MEASFIRSINANNSIGSNNGSNLTLDEDDYYYDYDASVSDIALEEFVPVAIVYGLTLLLGVVGNLLVIFSIMRYRRMQNVTNIFLTSLASADLLLVLICVPIKFAKWFSFTWNFGEVLCKLVHYLQNVSVICSILTLTTISMERYYAILHPMRAKYVCTVQRARRLIAVIWVSSFLLATPIIFGQKHKRVGFRRMAYWCIKEWSLPVYARLYEVAMLLLILLLPLAIMSFAYCSICKELWIMTSKRAAMRAENQTVERDGCYISANQANHMADKNAPYSRRRRKVASVDDDSTRKQVIKMLVAVILLFAICWGPTVIDNVLAAYGYIDKMNYGHLKHIRQAFVLMSYFNSCVNPIVYAFMSKNFRESFKYALCICVHGKKYLRQYRYSRQASFQTRSPSMTMTGTMSMTTKTDFEKTDFASNEFETEIMDTGTSNSRLMPCQLNDGDATL